MAMRFSFCPDGLSRITQSSEYHSDPREPHKGKLIGCEVLEIFGQAAGIG